MKITPDKEKGLDPIISNCFVCGKEKNELILTGNKGKLIRKAAGVHKDTRSLCFDKIPCQKCQNIMNQGVIFISCKDEDDGKENPYRTGGWCAVKPEYVQRIMPDVDFDKNRIFFVPDTVYDKLGLPRNEEINNMEAE